MTMKKISPIKSVSIVVSGLLTLLASVQTFLTGSSFMSDEAKVIVGFVCGLCGIILGVVGVIVRQLQGTSDTSLSPPIAWKAPGRS